MKEAFIIWTVLTVMFVIFGIIAWNSKKPKGFWANSKAPDASAITDVKKFNRLQAVMWFVFAVVFELTGLPFLVSEEAGPILLVTLVGVPVAAIGMMIAYTLLENKFRVKKGK